MIVFGEVRQLEQCSAMATFVLKVLIISSVSLALSLSARKNMLCMVVKKPFFLLENRSFSCLLAKSSWAKTSYRSFFIGIATA